jgi:hypothetical protein
MSTFAAIAVAALLFVPAVHAKTIYGSAAANTIRGTSSADAIYAQGGNDTVYALGGNDVVYGGRGSDRLYGGRGSDRIYGGPGRDLIYARDGHRDRVYCGRGVDWAAVDGFDEVAGCEHVLPASYFAGPTGNRNVVPLRGAFVGLWRSGNGTLTEQQARDDLLSREAYFGRKVDIWALHYGAPKGSCYGAAPFSTGAETWNWGRGVYTLESWSPGYTISQVNSGVADACFHDVAKRFKAFGHPVWFRLWHEFNGNWYVWSYDPSNAQAFIDAWRRVVGIFKSEGATNAMFTWCPGEGHYKPNTTPTGYPGDAYVDWVCSDGYNFNKSDAWCTTHPGWCEFWEIFHHGGVEPSVEQDFRGRKPYLVAETGSVEDPLAPGRKGQWMLSMRDRIKSDFPNLRALVYFDVDMSAYTAAHVNWRLDTSTSSYNGFRSLAQDAYFNTRP